MRTALYPGTFDPVTNGHLAVARRGRRVFDRVIVAVPDRPPKPALFSQEERVAMMREALAGDEGIEVLPFSGLTASFAERCGACALLRGMRALSDFEMELSLALMNRRLNPAVETVFLMTDYQWLFVSSSMVKDAATTLSIIRGNEPATPRHRK